MSTRKLEYNWKKNSVLEDLHPELIVSDLNRDFLKRTKLEKAFTNEKIDQRVQQERSARFLSIVERNSIGRFKFSNDNRLSHNSVRPIKIDQETFFPLEFKITPPFCIRHAQIWFRFQWKIRYYCRIDNL